MWSQAGLITLTRDYDKRLSLYLQFCIFSNFTILGSNLTARIGKRVKTKFGIGLTSNHSKRMTDNDDNDVRGQRRQQQRREQRWWRWHFFVLFIHFPFHLIDDSFICIRIILSVKYLFVCLCFWSFWKIQSFSKIRVRMYIHSRISNSEFCKNPSFSDVKKSFFINSFLRKLKLSNLFDNLSTIA